MVAILFDLEGTLIQTPFEEPAHIREFRVQTKKKLIRLGIPSGVLEGLERSTLMRNKASEYFEKNFDKAEAKRFHQEVERFLEDYELNAAKNSKLFPESLSTLGRLKKLGVKMGLVTNTSKKAVDMVFSLHGLGKYFDVVVTREDVRKLKPDPEGVLLVLKRLGEESFFMVGDSVFDALAAEKAGGASITVNRGSPNDLRFHTDHMVRSLTELLNIVKAGGKATSSTE